MLFTALASGGAVVVSQYLGKKEEDKASESVSQLLMVSMLFSVGMMVVTLIGNLVILQALSSVVALFGTYQIAANGIEQSIWSMVALVCVTMGPVFITVIGQCMGAGEAAQAEQYFKKLMKITMGGAVLWNGLIFAVTPIITLGYAIAPETRALIIQLVLIHNVFNAFTLPFADPLGRGLRAAGDVKYATAVSIFATLAIRLVFSYILAIGLNMGVTGIAFAMCMD